MPQFGHLRELKEIKSLLPFLKEMAIRMQCVIRLLEPDGTVIYETGVANNDESPACFNSNRPEEIITLWRKSEMYTQLQKTACLCNEPLLLLPIHSDNRVDGVMAVCPFAEDKLGSLNTTVGLINSYLALARDAIREKDKTFDLLNAHDDLYRQTELLETTEAFYSKVLETLLMYFNSDVGMFIPYNTNELQWNPPSIENKAGLSEQWLMYVWPLAIQMHDADRCPLILTPENRIHYPEFDWLNISSFISATVSYEGDVLGLMIFCSQEPKHILSFDDLTLLESLKGLIGLRLYSLQNREFKERFLENAFHNLKTPVHSIAGIIENLSRDDQISKADQHGWLEILSEQTRRLVRLTKSAQKFTHLQRQVQLRELVSLKEVVRSCVQGFQVLAEAKEVNLLADIPEDNCDIMANGDALYDVLQALIENGLNFSQAGQTVMVQLKVELSSYRVNVIDEGPGVPEHQQNEIFKEFVSISRAGVPESSGLGLAIAREIVESYNGVLNYEEGPHNRGACFWFTLPRNL